MHGFLPHCRTVLLRVSPPGGREQFTQLGGRGAQWVFVSGEARTGFSGTFAAEPIVTVNHNLGRRPSAVTVRTLGGLEVDVAVHHTNNNQLQLHFDVPTAGTIEIA